MDLPIRFPSQTEVIDEEVARFRALSPTGQWRAVVEMFDMYHKLAERSGRASAIREFAEMDELRARTAVTEFIARHG